MTKKRRTQRLPLPSQNEPRVLQVVEYEITSEPMPDSRYKRLPGRVKDAFERLHSEAQEQPHKAIPELLELIEKYPHMPMLYNYLSVAYSRSGQREKEEEAIQENYRRNPDYLFARLNYAQLCLAKRDYDKIAEIFEHKFDLQLLYPERKKFHISEVANFMGLMGFYFCETGQREVAEKYYGILKRIGRDYPMTKRLHMRLRPGLLGRLLRSMSGHEDELS